MILFSFSLGNILKWMWSNIPIVLLILSVGTFFSFVYGITEFLRNMRKGIAQLFTPLGGFVALCVFILVFVIYIMIKSMALPFN